MCWYLKLIQLISGLYSTSRVSPDCVKGGYDHVASIDISGKGGVCVEDILPFGPLCFVVDHLAKPGMLFFKVFSWMAITSW